MNTISKAALSFEQFRATANKVPDLAKALPASCYHIDSPGIVYAAGCYIEGPMTVYDRPVEKTGAHDGAFVCCIGSQEYVAYTEAELVKLERELYDFAVSEELVVVA